MSAAISVTRTETTTAPAGPAKPRTLFVGLLVAGLCTTASAALRPEEGQWLVQPDSQTAAGALPLAADVAPTSISSDVATLRRISGLTWEQLAALFGVSRRSMHFWASGGPMTAANANRLHQLVQFMAEVDRGSARENRMALLRQDRDGATPWAHLAMGAFDTARQAMNAVDQTGWVAALEASAESASRLAQPPAPVQLVQAEQDSIHRDLPGGRAVRALKRRGA